MTHRASAALKAALLLNQVNCCYYNYCKKLIIFWNEVIKLTHLMLSSVYFLVSQPSVQSIVLSYSPSYVCMKRNTSYRRLMESALFFPHALTLSQSTLSYCCFCMQPSGDSSQNTRWCKKCSKNQLCMYNVHCTCYNCKNPRIVLTLWCKRCSGLCPGLSWSQLLQEQIPTEYCFSHYPASFIHNIFPFSVLLFLRGVFRRPKKHYI